MNFLKKTLILSFFFINACADYKSVSKNKENKNYYSSSGFTLIYDDELSAAEVLRNYNAGKRSHR